MATPLIRPARAEDLDAINAIYNHYVRFSTCTYQEAPESSEGRREWFAHHGAAYPVTVAEAGGQIVGWGSLSPYHARCAYRHTVEDSIYVDPAFQGRGVGSALLRDLVERARTLGHHVIIAGIDAGQTPSLGLHARFGFAQVGHLREVGFKGGRWLDIIYMELRLQPRHPDPLPCPPGLQGCQP
jgi:phosphinothricin acetyltransferase